LLAALAAFAPPGHAGLRMIARSERLLPILRFVHEHWSQPIGRDELARRAALSPSRFHALFLETMGVPPLTYLRRLRMQQAQRLLVTTEEPVSRVGEQVGYPDAFQFSRQFRRVCGLSPSAYRERMRLPAMRPRESAAASGEPL
ncbi:MAG: helix-turn-helix transcriptional regulator, partial [Planctomycetes bacterium]|nr:helix-turn-helix transcriptional regulator [Planctomycetota bacterium]